MKKDLQKELTQSILEDDEKIKELEAGSKESFLATKAETEKIKALAELKKAKSEFWGNLAKGALATITVVATVGNAAVEFYKARNKNKTNQTIIKKQINRMEDWERNTFDNH